MIKRIARNDLKVGMFIHDLNCGWLKHSFVRNRFLIDDPQTLQQVLAIGMLELEIDTSLGLDIGEAPRTEPVEAQPDAVADSAEAAGPAVVVKRTPREEFERAKTLYSSANKLMQSMMKDVRLGKQIDIEQCEPMVDGVVDSMFSCPSALLPLAQMKSRDEYTFQHSVSVCALAVAFGRVLDMPRHEINEFALGGLLHDVGKAEVPGKILNKSSKLNDEEFGVMKGHVMNSARLIRLANSIEPVSEITFNAAAQHHERYDGTGYPYGLKGDDISLHGQMMAIVDVYDAITSIRAYHQGMPPTEALRKMFEWGGTHFNPLLVKAFIKGIGIYPAGSLVRMASNKLAIVREVQDKLLQPVVQVIYDCKSHRHLSPELVDLSQSSDKIQSHECFDTWKIDQAKWCTISYH